MVDYLVIKSLHLLGAVLLLGNVTVTGVWSLYLYRHWPSSGPTWPSPPGAGRRSR